MRTKTLLLAAAALAAGLVSSQAQSSNVYSVNIVGYVNKLAPIGFTPLANPLNTGTNGANQLIDNSAGQHDGSSLYVWNGTGFTPFLVDSGAPSGYTDIIGNPVPAPYLPPGVGFLWNNQVGASTLTFVGEVAGVIASISTSQTILASPKFAFVSSVAPVGGGIFTTLQMPNDGSLDGDGFQSLVGAGNGLIWTPRLFDSGSPSGVTDIIGNPVPETQIAVGEPFLFDNANAAPVIWNQFYP